MDRRDFLAGGASLGLMAMAAAARGSEMEKAQTAGVPKLTPPASGGIPVAFAVSEGATVIDFAGPWEVFQDVMLPERGGSHENQMPFRLFTVSEARAVVTASAGLKIVPDEAFETAPQPRVIVVPAQRGSKALHAWLRKASEKADVTMSVCTGAFQLARAGLLSGKTATTHHDFTDALAEEFPDIQVKRGLRFVENGKISTAGGLTSGIDLALRVVERYFGRPVAERTAVYMEYQSKGWMV
jgi:transcriptional regulator GlxA family with amidase domain